jgi:hypothetical protein
MFVHVSFSDGTTLHLSPRRCAIADTVTAREAAPEFTNVTALPLAAVTAALTEDRTPLIENATPVAAPDTAALASNVLMRRTAAVLVTAVETDAVKRAMNDA